MKRLVVLGILFSAGALSISAAALQAPAGGGQPAPRVVEVEKLRDNLYMLKGGGGNTAVFIRRDGVVVVDTKNPGWGQPMLDKIKSVTDKPVTTIINTHTHGDHVSGNVEFPATVEVVVAGEHRQEHGGDAGRHRHRAAPDRPPNIFKENNGTRHAEEDVQGQDDDRQGRRPDRSATTSAAATPTATRGWCSRRCA